jgi:TRAP-type uncharacterized transport system fused permease subunit
VVVKQETQEIEASKEMAQASEGGARVLTGLAGHIVFGIAVCMSLFQIYTGLFGELAGSKQLSIHLTFALILCYLCNPRSKKSPRDRISLTDIILAILGGAGALYLFVNYDHVVTSVGDAALYDLIIGGGLIILVLEATRRSVSPMLPIITIIFLLYAYFGPYLPGDLGHRGFRVKRIVDHIFMTGEGLWGVPLRVSATFVYLFVLFGAFLDKIGAGEYLINLSFALMGRFRGGRPKRPWWLPAPWVPYRVLRSPTRSRPGP